MNLARPLFVAAALTLFISACSTPDELAAPDLAPQFGTSLADRADVVVNDPKRGYAYIAGVVDPNPFSGYSFLRRYNQDGNLAWERRDDRQNADFAGARAVRLDAAGNVYLAYSGDDFDDGFTFAYVTKHDPAGKLIYKLAIDNSLEDLEVDAAGNLYLSGFDLGSPSEDNRFFLRKYDTTGKLLWQRLRIEDDNGVATNPTQAIARPRELGLGSDGSLYVAGDNAVLTKYTNTGTVVWQKARPNTYAIALTAAGQNVYLASNLEATGGRYSVLLQKRNSSGTVLWQKTISASEQLFIRYLAVDSSGGVYMAGRKTVGADTDLFVRKYTASGGVSWTYAPRVVGTNAAARGVSAKDGQSVYLAGVTDGKVNGRNFGNDDAFLLRLNSSGQKLWSR